MPYESLAKSFDTPFASEEHKWFKQDHLLNVGGSYASCTYFLGMLLNENLFRLSNETVRKKAKQFLTNETSAKGARVMDDIAGFDVILDLVKQRFLEEFEPPVAKPSIKLRAMRLILTKPNISFDELAKAVPTTKKQLARNSTLNYAARILRMQGVRTNNP